MCKLMCFRIFLCQIAFQNASALTLKKVCETFLFSAQRNLAPNQLRLLSATPLSTPLKTGYLSRLYSH